MRNLRGTVLGVATLSVCLLVPKMADANCGLDYCPLPDAVIRTPEMGVMVQALARHVEFSLPDGHGSYLENILRVEVQRFDHWNFGAWVAPVFLEIDGESRTGLSNPVLFVERRQPIDDSVRLIGGLQLEVPLGDSHDGIASGHMELLSYVGMLYEHRRVEILMQGGIATSLSEGHEHVGGNVIFVNPHEDQEAQARIAVIAPLLGGKLRTGLQVNSRTVIENVDPRHFVVGGPNCSYQITDSIGVLAQAEVPLTAAQRFDWRAGVGVTFRL